MVQAPGAEVAVRRAHGANCCLHLAYNRCLNEEGSPSISSRKERLPNEWSQSYVGLPGMPCETQK